MLKKGILAFALLLSFSLELFSQDEIESQLRKHVNALTADSLMGRSVGSKGESIASDYIYKVFREAGITNLYTKSGQDFSFVSDKGDTVYSKNVVAIIEGYDPLLKNEFVLIGAHYDHLGFNKIKIDGKDTFQIYSGADDNASGVATLLEVAKQIKNEAFNFKRSVIIAAFGAEEAGLMGSWYFVNRAFNYTDKIGLMINLDMVGRSGGDNFPRVYTVLPGVELSTMLKDISDLPAMISPKIYSNDYFPSDHQPFSSKGIPVALITTGNHRDYHTIKDLPENLDYKTMAEISRYVFELAKSSANLGKPFPKTALADKQPAVGKDEIIIQSKICLKTLTIKQWQKFRGMFLNLPRVLPTWENHFLKQHLQINSPLLAKIPQIKYTQHSTQTSLQRSFMATRGSFWTSGYMIISNILKLQLRQEYKAGLLLNLSLRRMER